MSKLNRIEVFSSLYAFIFTSKGHKVKISRADVAKVIDYYWYIESNGYPEATINGDKTYLHKYLLSEDRLVDHIDIDKLNNARDNLRYSDKQINSYNRYIQKNNSTGFKGVSSIVGYRFGEYWTSRIYHKGKVIRLGSYRCKLDAARAYNVMMIKKFGYLIYLNDTGDNYSKYTPLPRDTKGRYPHNLLFL